MIVSLTKREKTKRDAVVSVIKAIPTDMVYADYLPLVLAAVHKIGPIVWTWLDEGQGYYALGDVAFAKLRTVRNNATQELFKAVNAKR